MLDLKEWRVKNFMEGPAYGLAPSGVAASGKGTRRRYTLRDAFRIALAAELVKDGFAPEVVGEAIREIPESGWLPSPMSLSDTPVLVRFDGDWALQHAKDIKPVLNEIVDGYERWHGIYALNVQAFLHAVWGQIDRYLVGDIRTNAQGKKKRR